MWIVYLFGAIILIIVFVWAKNKIWDKPHEIIAQLKRDINRQKEIHMEEVDRLLQRLNNLTDYNANLIAPELADIMTNTAWHEMVDLFYSGYYSNRLKSSYSFDTSSRENAKKKMIERVVEAINDQYRLKFLLYLYPELANVFDKSENTERITYLVKTPDSQIKDLYSIVDIINNNDAAKKLILLQNRVSFLEVAQSNLTAIPYMAGIMADYETYGIERLAKELDWGNSIQRANKVKSIREIRKNALEIVERNKEAQYQLAYLMNLFPILEDVLDTEFEQLPTVQITDEAEHDYARNYISREEWSALSETERNQLALDRYQESHRKTKWQIGRDYELFVGYKYSQMGYEVDCFGSYMGLEDLGRDLIATKDNHTLIIQCKYWGVGKTIHEKHIAQLYGTMVSYCIENNKSTNDVSGVFVTNISLSTTARRFAEFLNIEIKEHFEAGDYPCIKCNINQDELGIPTKIYHLPFDQQYDSTKINKQGEFYAMTVAEAEAAGFRRAFKWHGQERL